MLGVQIPLPELNLKYKVMPTKIQAKIDSEQYTNLLRALLSIVGGDQPPPEAVGGSRNPHKLSPRKTHIQALHLL